MKEKEFDSLKKGDVIHRVNSMDHYTIIAKCIPVNGRNRYLAHRTVFIDAPMEWELTLDPVSSLRP